jgi:hypothetical protein
MRAEIENALYACAWGYDTGDSDLLAGCFTADAEVEFGDVGMKAGRAAVVAELERRRAKYSESETPWHLITNVHITDATDARARVRSRWTFFVLEGDRPRTLEHLGYYDDVFEREDGTWRIKRRCILRRS